MNDDEVTARRASFAAVADAYERARPEYPEEAARWLVGGKGAPLDVVDVAAGTGKLTRVLARLGHRVVAVEPLPEMLERLAAAVPTARTVEGTAESIPLPDASADAVVAAQAFHWFDQPAALRELGRVLRPGGTLGLVWNIRDAEVEWVARMSELIGGERLSSEETASTIDASGLYGPVEHETWRWEQPLDRRRLRELVLSRSYCASRPPEEREPILAAVDALHDEVAVDGALRLPYVTHAFRARRR